ncbi:hypothetical protein [Desulfovibrio inopinatus]|uniref:hypothetical protein n=1 Tax=Desulfovibrio inopinatus TaxID=102109 RepID=UPI00041F4A8E|nr:hypothetical protein [Desulfovibrio inopinatus]
MHSRLRCAPFFLVCCIFWLCFACPGFAQDKTSFLEGTYAGSETGDFNYLLLRTKNETRSFFSSPLFTDILDQVQPKLPIVIEFYTTTQYVEAAESNIDMQIIKSVFIADEYAPEYGITLTESPKP